MHPILFGIVKKLPLLLSLALASVALAQPKRSAPKAAIAGTWVSAPASGSGLKESLRFQSGSDFTATIKKPGRPVLIVRGTYRLAPPSGFVKKIGASALVLFLIDLPTAQKLGMPVSQQRMILRRRDRTVVMTRLLLIPSLPALTDLGKALFARKDQETIVAERFQALRRKLHY